ncbi:hypothetical protein BDV06DRAFT_184944 [Aspergillus oleicola]
MASITTQRARLSHINNRLPLPHLTVTSVSQQSHQRSGYSYSYSSALTLRAYSSKPNKGGKNTTRTNKPKPTSPSAANPFPDSVNPPPTTRPAEIAYVPSRAESSSTFKWLFAQGRAYLTFYKTGLKNVYHNYRTSLEVRRALGIPSHLPTVPDPRYFYKDGGQTTRTSRATFQLVHRAAHDVRRMIPFGLVLVVFGELTPILILLFGNAVTPYTCRIPKQIRDYRAMRMRRNLETELAITAELAAHGKSKALTDSRVPALTLLTMFARADWAEGKMHQWVMYACVIFGLAKSTTGVYGFKPLVNYVYRPRLERYRRYLRLDDQLIREGGGVQALTAEEVRIAVEERGGFVVPPGMEEREAEKPLRKWLEVWLAGSKVLDDKH